VLKEKFSLHFSQLLILCPHLDVIIGHMLVLRFGVRVQEVSWTSEITDWTEADCRNIGRSMASIIRMVQTGEDAVDAWRSNFPQLEELFQVEGFEVSKKCRLSDPRGADQPTRSEAKRSNSTRRFAPVVFLQSLRSSHVASLAC